MDTDMNGESRVASGSEKCHEGSKPYRLRVHMQKAHESPKKRSRRTSQKVSYDKRRAKLKADIEKYKQYKLKDASAKKRYRQQMTEDQRRKYNEGARSRMQKLRKKKTAEAQVKRLTRKEKLKLRSDWRKAKQKQRATLSAEDRARINAKRRQEYQLKQAKRKLDFHDVQQVSPPNADEIIRKINSTTPRTRQNLKKQGLVFTPKTKQVIATDRKIALQVRASLKELRKNKTKKGQTQYRWFLKTVAHKAVKDVRMRKRLEVQFHFWKWATGYDDDLCDLPARSDALSSKEKKEITDFYIDSSENLPCKNVRKSVLSKTIKDLHVEFQKKSGKKISLSSFRKLRPKECLTVDRNKFAYCLCEYCINIEFNLRSLKNAARIKGIKMEITTKYEVARKTICSEKETCLERNCSECGVGKLRDAMQTYFAKINTESITWQKWKNSTVDSTQQKRKVLVDLEGTVKNCIEDLCEQSTTLALHLFTAKWQREQVNTLKNNLPSEWLLSIADFAENYRCTNQDEISAAYYNYNQVTLLPMIAYYRCVDCRNTNIEESIVFISSDLMHDAHVVNKAATMMLEHLKKKRKFSPIHHVQVSDGCLAQFKSKNPFYYLSQNNGMERVYYGSRHGKSLCDGLGGTMKNKAERFVKARAGKIRDAKEFYDWCMQTQVIDGGKCTHKKRAFLFSDKIKRPVHGNLVGLKGTRKLHQIRTVKQGVVQGRKFACFCQGCLAEVDCENKNIDTEWWEPHELNKDVVVGSGQLSKQSKKRAVPKAKAVTGSTELKEKSPVSKQSIELEVYQLKLNSPTYQTSETLGVKECSYLQFLSGLDDEILMEQDEICQIQQEVDRAQPDSFSSNLVEIIAEVHLPPTDTDFQMPHDATEICARDEIVESPPVGSANCALDDIVSEKLVTNTLDSPVKHTSDIEETDGKDETSTANDNHTQKIHHWKKMATGFSSSRKLKKTCGL